MKYPLGNKFCTFDHAGGVCVFYATVNKFTYITLPKKIVYFNICTYENKRRGPDHQCSPSTLCGPIISDGPKVPSLCFIISRKNV